MILSKRNATYCVYTYLLHHMVYFTQQVTCMGKNQHVVTHPDGWAVKGEGNERATSVHSTQAEAIEAAREIARHQQSELLIHGRDGQIRSRDSYGNDPYPPKG